jgi:hypothetical protein
MMPPNKYKNISVMCVNSYYKGYKIKKDEVGGACSTYEKDKKCGHNLSDPLIGSDQ